MSSHSTVIKRFVEREPDKSKHSAAYKIFRYEWDIMLPLMYVYSEEYMRISGSVISDPVYDAKLPRQMVGGRYTIEQMAVLLDEGATIQLVNPEDAKTIYDIVATHLEDWSRQLTKAAPFDLTKAPVEDLMKLMSLADVLYGYACRYFVNERPRNSLARRLDQIRGRYKLGSGRARVDPNAPVPAEQKPRMSDHSVASESILKHSVGRNSWS